MTTASPQNTIKGHIPKWVAKEVVTDPTKAATTAVQNALGVTLTTQPLPGGVSGVTGFASNLTSVATDGQDVEVFSFNSSNIPASVSASLPKMSIPTAGGSAAVTFSHKNIYIVYVGVTKNQSSALKSAIDGL